jgi:hypothetical protein
MTIHKLKNITYDLHKMEKALVFQILEQDESWRRKWIKTEKDFYEEKDFYSAEYTGRKNGAFGEKKGTTKPLSFSKTNKFAIETNSLPLLNVWYKNDYAHNSEKTITGVSINLRGYMENFFFKIVSEDFYTNQQRDIAYTKINQALKEWDNHVEKLKEGK